MRTALFPDRNNSSLEVARIFATNGNHDEAVRWLEKAYEERDPFMSNILNDGQFDDLHDDPRFLDIAHRVGLPDPA